MNGLRKNAKNLHFWTFWAKMANFGQFFSRLQALTNCKVSEKVMNGFRETARWTDKRTDGRESLGLQQLRRDIKK